MAAIKKAESGGKFDALIDSELMALAADKGIDPAIGRSEIIKALEAANHSLLDWRRERGVRFTRGRPYRKNDGLFKRSVG